MSTKNIIHHHTCEIKRTDRIHATMQLFAGNRNIFVRQHSGGHAEPEWFREMFGKLSLVNDPLSVNALESLFRSECFNAETLHQQFTMKLSLLDRLRVLLRGEVRLSARTPLPFPVGRTTTDSILTIPPIFPKRDRSGEGYSELSEPATLHPIQEK